ncbi:alkaline phosphatase D family protein [Corynebacterium pelargi]|uniref:Phospholipase D n=1 Tax=Corynebacterium pelargi TaxID=1471400 RepID=A0A410W6S3_9CORY|nr:alkaline phosphatase D family protein [Corynebacterium pelargi]QAU51574.1 Phospholipase D precursor [Corynebacterium pelargi]GGG82443.1 phosphodiesterase/alkaline phosphatase D [Corynebacterium pelargi]
MSFALNRRRFLQLAASTSAVAAVSRTPARAEAQGVFQHSVASGDPEPNAVIIWTRVTPQPDATPGSGVGAPTAVRWEVATDDAFNNVVASGEVTTGAERDHTVKVDVRGLAPYTHYFYRFQALEQTSRVGHTLTAPAEAVEAIRFGVVSCSNYEAGYFRSYRSMAERMDLDFVLHLGDYTYEYATGEYLGAHKTQVRTVQPPQRTTTLTDYRIRQGWYHLDPDLADLHAVKPMIAIWDDHEFADNVWRDGAAGDSFEPGDDIQALRAAATQAYLEWMPVRRKATEPVYRSFSFGPLMDIIVPDLRTYRDKKASFGLESNDPQRTMMGQDQFSWFREELNASDARWQVIANSVMFAPMTLPPGLDARLQRWLIEQIGLPEQGIALNNDQWDGYMAERQQLIDAIAEDANVVFLTGDIHSSWASEIPRNIQGYREGSDARVAAAEFVTPSVSAQGAYEALAPSQALEPVSRQTTRTGANILRSADTWFKYIDFEFHGYMAVEVRQDSVKADWWYTDNVLSPDMPFRQAASFITRAGDHRVTPA